MENIRIGLMPSGAASGLFLQPDAVTCFPVLARRATPMGKFPEGADFGCCRVVEPDGRLCIPQWRTHLGQKNEWTP
ncbi:MAG: hypothetical protein JNM28_07270 [Armatimonadetes bacterium]|nr:hypothetical protein [Armatimonadota bacterium]